MSVDNSGYNNPHHVPEHKHDDTFSGCLSLIMFLWLVLLTLAIGLDNIRKALNI